MKKRPVFAIALVVTLLFAVIASKPGKWLYDLGWTSTVTIMLMYAGMGLNTDTTLLRRGLEHWRLHIAVQSALFILAPVLSIFIFSLLQTIANADRAVGLLFIGAVPTTITSCIMLTKRYDGNTIGSMYNAVLSQVLGIVITPLILCIVLSAQFESVSSFQIVFLNLIKKMILPFFVGQVLRRFKDRLGKAGQVISFYGIFFILYMNLAKVASRGNLLGILSALAVPLIATLVLCVLQVTGTWLEGLVLHFSNEDRICLLFTGSQKTLGMGVPLASIYFASSATIAMDATLVIIAYYLMAMVFSVFMVQQIVRNNQKKQPQNSADNNECND